MIQQSEQPKGLNELKIAKKACNRFGYSDKFSDNGISYKYMAQKIGCGLQKVHYMTIYEQMLGYIRREPFVVCRIKRSC